MTDILLCTAVLFLSSYLFGSIPFGYLIGRLNGIDIRKYGSHNIGATNVTRVLGSGYGRICFLLDFLKGVLPVLLLGARLGGTMPVGAGWGEIIAAAGTIVGHVYPFWLDFKGGKGVATSIGAILAMAFWPMVVALLVWYGVYRKTMVVGAASIACAAATPLAGLLFRLFGWGNLHWPTILLMFVIGCLIIWRHRENIRRMREGRENTFRK